MNGVFQLAAGSIVGQEHRQTGRNNQDAWAVSQTDAATIAVVCDGCGSGRFSEVGAKLGARLIVQAIQQAADLSNPEILLQSVQVQVLTELQNLIKAMGGDWVQTIQDYFLFTVVGVLITPMETLTFAMGDGEIALNGAVTTLGPFPNNAPPYLAYGLLDTAPSPVWQVCHHVPTEQVQSVLIGTDGVVDLLELGDRALPGKSELVGGVEQFWQQDRYFANPDMVRRRLALINREGMQPDWQQQTLVKHPGLLRDDTTLVVVRRVRTPLGKGGQGGSVDL